MGTFELATRAATPPMGWNSWNHFLSEKNRARIFATTSKAIIEQAEALVSSGMAKAGYEYVVLDDCWQAKKRDIDGKLVSDPVRFPEGIAYLSERVHALGLKFGLYSVPGSLTCAQQWDNYGGDPLGSYRHEEVDAKTFAEWNVDFLKYDWCKAHLNDGLFAQQQYALMRKHLDDSGRSITYSISEYGLFDPHLWAPGIAHMWRTTDDLFADWDSILKTLDKQRTLWPYSRPGAWNDPDMLQVGNGKLTENENRAHFLMWVILNAPLMAGHDVTKMDESTRALLCNPDLIAINQDWGGSQGRLDWELRELEFWVKPMSSGAKAFVILNRGEMDEQIKLDLETLDLGSGPIVEVISGERFENDGELPLLIGGHDARLFIVENSI